MISIAVLAPERDLSAAAWLCASVSRRTGSRTPLLTAAKELDALPDSLVLSFSGQGDSLKQNYTLQQSGRTWLRLVLRACSGTSEAGPLFLPGLWPCYTCFQSFFPSCQRVAQTQPSRSRDAFLCEALANPLLSLTQSLSTGQPLRRFTRLNQASLKLSQHRTLSRVGCRCRQGDLHVLHGLPDHCAPLPIFEDLCSNEYPEADRPSGQGRRVSVFVGRSLVPAHYPSCKKISLGAMAALSPRRVCSLLVVEPLADRVEPSLEELTALLGYTAGFRTMDRNRRNAQRFAASGGNLGSAELFLLTTGIPRLQSGLYRYRPARHDLVDLASRTAPAWAERFLGPVSTTALVFCGMLARLKEKYGAFAFRLMHLDAGIAFSQAALVAKAQGLRLSVNWLTQDRMQDLKQLSDMANLVPERELITAVATLSASGEALPGPPQDSLCGTGANLLPYPLLGSVTAEDLIPMLLEQGTTCQAAPVTARSFLHTRLPRASTLGDANAGSLTDTLLRRASVRSFGPTTVSFQKLSELLLLAISCDRADWPVEAAHGNNLKYFILLQQSHGTRRLMRFEPETATLVEAAMSNTVSLPLYLNRCFESAQTAIWIVGDPERAIARAGPRVYQQLLFRAGAAANRLWLAGLEQGLTGSIVAGLLTHNARAAFGFDGWQQLPLCALVIGGTVPATPEAVGFR